MSIDIENIIQHLKMTELYDHDLSCAIEALEEQQEAIKARDEVIDEMIIMLRNHYKPEQITDRLARQLLLEKAELLKLKGDKDD